MKRRRMPLRDPGRHCPPGGRAATAGRSASGGGGRPTARRTCSGLGDRAREMGRLARKKPRGASLRMIRRAQWHNQMKAPPCMRWRGLHLAFVVKAARFSGPFSPLGHHRTSDHLKHRLPDAQPRNHVTAKSPPQFDLLGGLPSRRREFSTPADRIPQGVRPTFSLFPTFPH